MFGQNEVVGRKFFKDMPERTLYVTSIFYTLQGEGPFMGQPAVFLRLGKCNLDCSFCDTYFDHGEIMTFEAIEAKIMQILNQAPIGNPLNPELDLVLVITGGEPTIQPNLPEFITSQVGSWANIQLETNGTQPEILEQCFENAVIVVSPKCVEVNGVPDRYLNIDHRVSNFAYCFKFVVSADPASAYHEVPGWVHQWVRHRERCGIYISPMNVYNDQPREMKITVMRGTPTLEERSTIIEKVSFWEEGLLNREANKANHEYAATYCMKHGFRLNLQMHLYVSIA